MRSETDLEGTEESLVDRHHRTCIVEFSTVITIDQRAQSVSIRTLSKATEESVPRRAGWSRIEWENETYGAEKSVTSCRLAKNS